MGAERERVGSDDLLGRSGVAAETQVVTVRWRDGYIERFSADEVRAGADLLWIRLSEGGERNIPLREVRWFARTVESHEATP